MKKIVLIVFISAGGLLFPTASRAQVGSDTLALDTLSQFTYTSASIRFRLGFNVGYEALNARRANSTITTPVGVDLRFYTNPFNFWQLGLSGMHMIITDSLFTIFAKTDISYHSIHPFYTTSFGLIYNQSVFNYGAMIGARYGYETQRIPMVVSYMYSFKYKTQFFLIGLSIPIGRSKVLQEKIFKGDLSKFRYAD